MRARPFLRPRPGSSRCAGFTLVELMVSLVIGFAVVGALVAAYLSSLRGAAHSDAMVQLTEDATLALNVVRAQVAQAGFSGRLKGTTDAAGLPTAIGRNFPALLGCARSNFGSNLNIGIQALAPIPYCTGASDSDAIEVAYEARVADGTGASNAILGGADGRTPLDCLGNAIPSIEDLDFVDHYFLNDSKFYVDGGNLYCHGPGAAAGAVLVEHVDTLRVTFGVADGADASQITYYAPATDVTSWSQVIAVSICVQVRSAQKVLDTTSQATLGAYIDCDNNPGTLADGYLHRSFSTTVVLQNKMGEAKIVTTP